MERQNGSSLLKVQSGCASVRGVIGSIISEYLNRKSPAGLRILVQTRLSVAGSVNSSIL